MMTREEAIKHLLHDWHINLGCDFAIKPGRLDDFLAALDVALSALRPVSREQVEKVWRGEWLNFYNDVSAAECSKCGELCEVSPDETPKEEFFKAFSGFYHFCPACGAPMTDEAMQMLMERLEALKDGNSTD